MAAGGGERRPAVARAGASEATSEATASPDPKPANPYSMFAIQQPSPNKVNVQLAVPTQDSAALSQPAGDDSEANADDTSTLPTDICPDTLDSFMSEEPFSSTGTAARQKPTWSMSPDYCSLLDMPSIGPDDIFFDAVTPTDDDGLLFPDSPDPLDGYTVCESYLGMIKDRDRPSSSDDQRFT
ncbi:hypothetical protein GQ53DRAFT_330102 [Thozetella sp. PMI_491]|nr:hypothetical protein GQ53DRAFT_330102 [Thozetella sp. PMI_491]